MRPAKKFCDECGKEEDQEAEYCSECGSDLIRVIDENYPLASQYINNKLNVEKSPKLINSQITESDLTYCYKCHYRGNPVYANVRITVLIKRFFKLLGFLLLFGLMISLFAEWGLLLIIYQIFAFFAHLTQEDKVKDKDSKAKNKRKRSSKSWRCSNRFDTEIRKLTKREIYGQ